MTMNITFLALMPVLLLTGSALSMEKEPSKELQNRLKDAILHGTEKQIEDAIRNGADPNGKLEFEHVGVVSPLALAANKDDYYLSRESRSPLNERAIVKILLKNGAKAKDFYDSIGTIMDQISHESRSAAGYESTFILNTAETIGQAKEDLGIIGQRKDKEYRNKETGKTALHLAAINDDITHVIKLIKAGAQLDAKDFDGNTPLHEAAYYNSLASFIALVDAGASLAVKDKNGLTPYEKAKHKKLIVQFIEERTGKTPLHLAAIEGNLREVKKFITNKEYDESYRDEAGNTAVHEAAFYGNLDVLKYLYQMGFNMFAPDKHGYSPLQKALSNKQQGTADFIRSKTK